MIQEESRGSPQKSQQQIQHRPKALLCPFDTAIVSFEKEYLCPLMIEIWWMYITCRKSYSIAIEGIAFNLLKMVTTYSFLIKYWIQFTNDSITLQCSNYLIYFKIKFELFVYITFGAVGWYFATYVILLNVSKNAFISAK